MFHNILPIPGDVRGWLGWSSEQPGFMSGAPAHGRGLEWDDPEGPFQPKQFQDSVIVFSITAQNSALKAYPVKILTENGLTQVTPILLQQKSQCGA